LFFTDNNEIAAYFRITRAKYPPPKTQIFFMSRWVRNISVKAQRPQHLSRLL
jgi:hypothetical protein